MQERFMIVTDCFSHRALKECVRLVNGTAG